MNTYNKYHAATRCPSPDLRTGLTVTYTNTTFGSVAVYSCALPVGYRLAGNNTRVCQPDGTWTGIAPYCLSNYKIIFATTKSSQGILFSI